MHSGWFYNTKPIAADHFSETLRSLKIFVYLKAEPRGLLISKPDCLKRPGAQVSL